jgi:hypothetical protein
MNAALQVPVALGFDAVKPWLTCMSMGGDMGMTGLDGHGWTIEPTLGKLERESMACNRTTSAAAKDKEASAHAVWDGCPRRRWRL